MKKMISIALGLAAALSVAAGCVFAKGTEKDLKLLVNGQEISITAYKEGENVMLPVRAVAEKLGFSVVWDEERMGVKLDNGEVNTVIYIGEDNYYMASSQAIGMSAPCKLGAAPVLVNDKTYAPAGMFDVLYCKKVVSAKDGAVLIDTKNTSKEESVQIPNPFTEHKTVEEAKKALPFEVKEPSSVPEGYSLTNITTMSGEMLQLVYENGKNEITYRTAKGAEDIGGDYNVYNVVKTVKVGDADITIRANTDKEGGSAVWTNGGYTFSVYFDGAFYEKDMLDILKELI